MQTGFFYVRLRPELATNELRFDVGGRSIFLAEAFAKNRPYPVLAVESRHHEGSLTTYYHIPTETNQIAWFPSELFLFARD